MDTICPQPVHFPVSLALTMSTTDAQHLASPDQTRKNRFKYQKSGLEQAKILPRSQEERSTFIAMHYGNESISRGLGANTRTGEFAFQQILNEGRLTHLQISKSTTTMHKVKRQNQTRRRLSNFFQQIEDGIQNIVRAVAPLACYRYHSA